jgi:MFS family permease
MTISLLGMTFITSLDNIGFLALSLISRAFGGLGLACIYISNMSMISSEFPTKLESYISMMEAFGGFGLMMAPIYSTYATEEVSFSASFFFVSLGLLVFIPIYWFFTGSKTRVQEINEEEEKEPAHVKLNKNMIIDLCILVYCYTVLCFLEPSLSLYLASRGVSDYFIGLVFTGMTCCYTMTNFIMAFLAKFFKIYKIVPYSACICTFGLLSAGPVGEFFDSVYLSIFGAIITGVGVAIAFVSVLPSIIKEAIVIGNFEDAVAEDLSGLVSMGMNMGEITGPIFSGIFALFFNFSGSCFILSFAGIALIFSSLLLKTKSHKNKILMLIDKEIDIK